MLMEADAALLIGDDALRAKYKHDPRLYVYDLGQEWKEMTGLPMVFSVWAIRKDFAERNFDQIKIIKETFVDCMNYSLQHIEDVASKAAQWEEFSDKYLVDYFNSLRFDFDEKKQEGLLEYYKEAYKMGLIDDVPPLDIIEI
jgi:chorismate dehydratase